MSVVNTMLRELAERQQAGPDLKTTVQMVPAARSRWPWWFGATIIAAVGIVGWRWQSQSPPRPLSTAEPNRSVAAETLTPQTLTIAIPDTTPAASTSAPISAIVPAATAIAAPLSSGANTPAPSNAKPATIGWELVAPENQIIETLDPHSDSEISADWPEFTTTAPASQTRADSRFDRQPAKTNAEEQLNQLRQQARLALAAGDWRGAEAACESGLLLMPEDVEFAVLKLQALALYAPEQASAAAMAMLQAGPSNWPIRQWLGTALLQQGQFANGLALLSDQTPTLVGAPDYHAVLALAEQQTGAHVAAAARYRNLLSLQASNGRHAAGLALSLEPLGDFSGAMAAWRLALRDPTLPLAVSQFGRQRLQQLSATSLPTAPPTDPNQPARDGLIQVKP